MAPPLARKSPWEPFALGPRHEAKRRRTGPGVLAQAPTGDKPTEEAQTAGASDRARRAARAGRQGAPSRPNQPPGAERRQVREAGRRAAAQTDDGGSYRRSLRGGSGAPRPAICNGAAIATGQAGGSAERNGGEGPQVREARPPPGPRPSERGTAATRSGKVADKGGPLWEGPAGGTLPQSGDGGEEREAGGCMLQYHTDATKNPSNNSWCARYSRTCACAPDQLAPAASGAVRQISAAGA